MRAHIVSLIVSAAIVLTGAMTLEPALVAGKSDEGLCRLLSAKEVRQALGKGKWQIADDGDVPEQCYMHNGRFDDRSRAFSMRLLASNQENQQDWHDEAVSSGDEEHQIAGFRAVQDRRGAVVIFLPDPWDILQLSPVGYDDEDVSGAMLNLATLAAERYGAELGAS